MESAGEAGDGNPPPEGWKKPLAEGGDTRPIKRQMKSPYQLEILEKTYATETYPSEALRAELSAKTGLTDRQLQMWFCHRRLKDRKPPPGKRQRREDELMQVTPPAVGRSPLPQKDVMTGSGSAGGVLSSSSFGSGESRRAIVRTSATIGKRYYDSSGMMPPHQPMLTVSELQVLSSIEAQLGEPLREDGPALGVEFDPLPPGAFGAPLDMSPQQKQPFQSYDSNIFERHEAKAIKPSAFLPSMDHSFVLSSSNGKRRSLAGNSNVHPHVGTRALHEYQFLPEQPSSRSEAYDRASQSHFYDSSIDSPRIRAPSLPSGGELLHGADQVTPSYTFQGQMSSCGLLSHQGRQQVYPSGSTDYDNAPDYTNSTNDAQFGVHQVMGIENSYAPSERTVFHDEDVSRWERKRKSDEARIAKEVEAHERRIRKELEKQDIMRRKKEGQMRKEMERHDRERRKEEERMMREKQREEERLQREQKREIERREKSLLKESRRAEKMRQKEELRREKEAARQKAASERATARRIAKEYMDLVEDERLELMELAAASKGFSSILALDSDTLQQLDSFKGMLSTFPPTSVQLRKPFAIQPWTNSEENIANLLMVWKFIITFADVLGLWPFTLDEFVQSLHDYDSRLLGEIHVALLKSIIKDIEDVARTPAIALGSNQNSAVNPGGGHPHIVQGAYAWGFNIHSWQRNLNYLTWPEILRQFALSAGFGPQLKKRNVEHTRIHDENEGNDGEDVITTLRDGSAVENAVVLMQERGYTHRRRSRHRLTPGTVKFAAFHVLSLEGSKGLTILEVADKIQRSGLRDLTTSKTPEASIAAALSRDTKLFERTAPSTYCVRSPYRKDPADADAILSMAREKIQVFQSAHSDSEDAEKDVEDADDAERDEDSEGDAPDDAEVDDALVDLKLNRNSPLGAKHKDDSKILIKVKADPLSQEVGLPAKTEFGNAGKGLFTSQESTKALNTPGTSQSADLTSNGQEESNFDMGDTEIDESCFGEPWVQGLSEGDYSDLSVEERLNALVALIGVAIEGNSIRVILEDRLEAASALKKQMWAEAQLDKRRFREEYSSKLQYNPSNGYKNEAFQTNGTREGSQVPFDTGDRDNYGNVESTNNDQSLDQQNQINTVNMSSERNSVALELLNPEIATVQQYGYALEKSRSQLKTYIGHKAEQLYVYRSLPLGQDRRRNRYWLFSTSASPNDPGCGRIFFESGDGCWRLIDSEEAFDALLTALDTRGIRESHLHSMLQRIEATYKEAIKRQKNCENAGKGVELIRHSSETNSSPDCSAEFDAPSSTVCGCNSDVSEYSTAFHVELARNNIEKGAALKRYQGFLKWMWKECYNPFILCAMKYGKKRCPELLHTCDSCFQSSLAEENHCPSCHMSFKSFLNSEMNFSDHVTHCEQKRKLDADSKLQVTDSAVAIGIRLLKAQLAIIEVCIPAEALQSFWTDGYRKSWGVKLHSSSTAEELFQILTLLECAIKRDYLSSNYETTNELLSSTAQGNAVNNVAQTGSLRVLPWVPDTAAAVTLRLLELDSSLSYVMQEKQESHKDKVGDCMKLSAQFAVPKSTQELEPLEIYKMGYQNKGIWLDSGSGRRGRGRSNRGRGGRGRGRGSRGLRGSASSIRREMKDDNADNFVKNTRKYNRRGRTCGRGRKRGRRTVRPRQRSEGRIPAVKKPTTLRTFNGVLSSMNQVNSELSPASSPGEEWQYEESRRPFIEHDDSVAYQSDENDQASEEEYDYQVADYGGDDYDEGKPIEPIYDESEEEDADVDMVGDEDMEDDANHIDNNENDIDGDMYDEDDDMEDDADGTGNVEGNIDEDGGSSYSSEYSD